MIVVQLFKLILLSKMIEYITVKLSEYNGYENELAVGDTLSADFFEEGDFVDVAANTKGKGFQGVVKRYNFRGVGGRTHGQHNRQRTDR